jgi:hypothetical protein
LSRVTRHPFHAGFHHCGIAGGDFHHRHPGSVAVAGAGGGQKTRAENPGIQQYDSAYSRFPVSSAAQQAAAGTNDFTYGGYFNTPGTPTFVGNSYYPTNNSEVIAILMDITNYPNTGLPTANANHQKNPQQTSFLSAKMGDANNTNGVVGPDLVYRDPWGDPYVISMDLNYDEQCNDAFYSTRQPDRF